MGQQRVNEYRGLDIRAGSQDRRNQRAGAAVDDQNDALVDLLGDGRGKGSVETTLSAQGRANVYEERALLQVQERVGDGLPRSRAQKGAVEEGERQGILRPPSSAAGDGPRASGGRG
jgi:hypothetical protein